MADQSYNKSTEAAPEAQQAAKFVAAACIGGALLVMSGLTLTGTVVGLVLVTPLLLIFSPVLVPAGIAIFLAVSGFIFSGGMGIAAVSALSWIYRYATGKHPVGSEQLDQARMRLANKARDVKERAKEYGQYVQNKAQEVTEGS
ncbi:oleosin Ara h 15.0101-like [Aristolochia californica]|uniref:oleosin Ara h 15.0101-like n=1 Tax=Aristolochia californica TaxID=171875 RepID=UPI0035D6012E